MRRSIFQNKFQLLTQIKEKLKASENNVVEKIDALKKDLTFLKKNKTSDDLKFSKNKIIMFRNYKCYFDILDIDQKELKNLSDLINKNLKTNIVILVTKNNNKISVVVSVSEEIIKEFDAITIVKKIVDFLGGQGGGGRKDMAQGGAPLCNKIETLKDFIKNSVLVF